MRIALFGGSFDPVHREHVRMARAAVETLGLDKLFIVPSFLAPHKAGGASAGGEERLEMCRLAFRKVKNAEVSDLELRAGGTSYTYLTCRAFRERYPQAEIFFLMGADMFADFPHWKMPEDILSNVKLAVCGRGDAVSEAAREEFAARFHAPVECIPFVGEEVSSTDIRVKLAFGLRPKEMDAKVYSYVHRRGLYADPVIPAALKLERPRRREHSLRVARMACGRARSLGIPEHKALIASALHDCGKYVPLSSPLLADFDPPFGVPAPVMHQFTGAYLAEHVFGVTDEDVLNAIRYHTSGRGGMSELEELIYLSDLLEAERDFAGIAKLREMFRTDLHACLVCSLALQIDFLLARGGEIYELTREAYEWAKSHPHS